MRSVPKPILANREEQKAYEVRDDFLLETRRFVNESYRIKLSDLEIKSGQIKYGPPDISDDRITSITYKGITLASVIEITNPPNLVYYTFFRNLRPLEKLLKK